MRRVMIYAELGSNPAATGWRLDQFVEAAALADADGVKIQLWAAEHFPLAEQESKRRVEFPRDQVRAFAALAHVYGLTAGASVFDPPDVRAAAEWCDWLKLAAREQDNAELQALVVRTGKRSYRSISHPSRYAPPWPTLATVQQYPLPLGAALLQVLRWVAFFRLNEVPAWGWSSHTRSALDVWLAVALGAGVIEKHLALDSNQPESGHSLRPAEFARMCARIRRMDASRRDTE